MARQSEEIFSYRSCPADASFSQGECGKLKNLVAARVSRRARAAKRRSLVGARDSQQTRVSRRARGAN